MIYVIKFLHKTRNVFSKDELSKLGRYLYLQTPKTLINELVYLTLSKIQVFLFQ